MASYERTEELARPRSKNQDCLPNGQTSEHEALRVSKTVENLEISGQIINKIKIINFQIY